LSSPPGVEKHDRVFDVPSRLGKLGYDDNETAPVKAAPSTSDSPLSAFIDIGDQGVTVFDMDTVDSLTEKKETAHWKAHFTHDDKEFFIEAPREVLAASKNSLVSLLELGEEMECNAIWMIVDKTRDDFRSLVQTLTFLGFRLHPQSSRTKSGCVLMRFED